MDNKELAKTLKGLSDFIEVKEEINNMKAGVELDVKFAKEILGMTHSPIVTHVQLDLKKKVSTQWKLASGQPALLPRISRDNNLAVMLLQDIGQQFEFEYRDGVFKVPYEDKAMFTGASLGEAVMKSLLFGKALKEKGVE